MYLIMAKDNKQKIVCDYICTNYVEHNRLRYDTVAGKVQIRDGKLHTGSDPLCSFEQLAWRNITDADINDMVCDIAELHDISVSAREVLTVLQSHQIPHIHPLRDWLAHLPPYDPASGDWISDLSHQVKLLEGDTLWHNCFKKWFVGMVASWLDDEVVNHQVLVLIGKQGIYKTTWLERLIPPELRAYSCKMASGRELGKDERLRIAESALIALDEIDAMSPRELNQMKSVITSTDVNERAAYGYTKERKMRLASFCASGNKREFLTDMTGNRRWLPFEVESIQNPFYTTLPYRQLYGQAVWLIEQGYNYWFDSEDIRTMEEHNEEFREQLNEEQLLSVYFGVPADNAPSARFMTTAEISDRLVVKGSIKKPMSLSQLGIVLGKAGYKSTRKGKARIRGWIVYERPAEEINKERAKIAFFGGDRVDQ